ncbi:MAG: hypothetical protein P9L94_11105 [Candidatus Hinthialibacter antarcticus]|nr:hypothetical protein [Candidatus Hinthialibacter antarcticus]
MLPVNLMGDAAAATAMVVQSTKKPETESSANANRFNRELSNVRDASRLTVTPLSTIYTYNPVRAHEERLPTFWRRKHPSDQREREHELADGPKPRAYQPLLFDMRTDRVADEYQHGRHAERMGVEVDMRI